MSDPISGHDFDAQRAETRATYAELRDGPGLPEFADVDYFLLPASDDADWRALADALSNEGFDCEWVEDDDDTGDGGEDAGEAGEDTGPYLVATLADQMISADAIWLGEEIATRIALVHGFAPDGWGLLGDGED